MNKHPVPLGHSVCSFGLTRGIMVCIFTADDFACYIPVTGSEYRHVITSGLLYKNIPRNVVLKKNNVFEFGNIISCCIFVYRFSRLIRFTTTRRKALSILLVLSHQQSNLSAMWKSKTDYYMHQHNRILIHSYMGEVVKVDHNQFSRTVVYNSCCWSQRNCLL